MNDFLENQIIQIAVMYYDQDVSQKEISEIMGLSKMTISRMLQRAKEMKYVSTNIQLPFTLNKELAESLEGEYRIDKAYVVKTRPGDLISKELARVWAFYMGIMDLNNKVIGIGVGNTLGFMVDSLTPMNIKNTHVVQLMGGLQDVTNFNPFTIVQEISKKLNAKGTFLTSFAIVDNKKAKDSILSSSHIGNELKKADIAIFGIGAMDKGTFVGLDFVDSEFMNQVKDKGAVGDILGHCFDSRGNFIESELEERIVSISINHLRNFKQRIALAGGDYKKEAIKGALSSKLINTLVIDENTAKLLI